MQHIALIPWLDPETIIAAAGPWALLVVCFIVFAETGLLIGFLLLTILTTWFAGRCLTFERIMSRNLPLDEFIEGVRASPPLRGPGVGVYLGSNSGITPQALSSHYRHAAVLPTHVCVLAVVVESVPHVPREEQPCPWTPPPSGRSSTPPGRPPRSPGT